MKKTSKTIAAQSLGISDADSPFPKSMKDWAHNLLVGTRLRKMGASVIQDLLTNLLFLDMMGVGEDDDDITSEGLLRAGRRYVRRHKRMLRVPRAFSESFAANINLLGDLVSLSEAEREVLAFSVAMTMNDDLREFVGAVGELPVGQYENMLAVALARPASELECCLKSSGRLVSSGLMSIEGEISPRHSNVMELADGLINIILRDGLTTQDIFNKFVPKSQAPTLEWDDYKHLAEQVRFSEQLLKEALASDEKGINILFYGESGTGKTELARLLGKELDVPLLVVGKADDEGDSPSKYERVASLRLAHKLAAKTQALLLFDEIEDLFESNPFAALFGGRQRSGISKQWFNLLLENNETPTIWISNEVSGMDPAFLRRFSFAIEFRPLGKRHREKALRRHLGDVHQLDDKEIAHISGAYQASPGQLATAVSGARLIGGEQGPRAENIERVLAPTEKLLRGQVTHAKPAFESSSYRLDAINTRDDLPTIVKSLKSWKPKATAGVSMVIYGPPGTGKSEFVHYLGSQLEREVVTKRASDILSMWVGGSEQNIARAFEEAQDEDAILLFDEVDSLLRERGLAQRSWEVTQVNEFLQQLENFRGIVACTTNLWKDIDKAALRRFIFKAEFQYLRPQQSADLFNSFFIDSGMTQFVGDDEKWVRKSLSQYSNLAPGDFAAVARRLTALGSKPEVGEVLRLLEGEVAVKKESASVVGGFVH